MLAFGPVPSRRLGFSLGINHIPQKHCPYACVYCQVGRTTAMEISRRAFYPPEKIFGDVEIKISEAQKSGQKIDYLTLVPDGEPTLDLNLGFLIKSLKQFRIPIAVISNAALIDQPEVQEALSQADWVSVKVDAVNEKDWHKVNRPHGRLSLAAILAGILAFRTNYRGRLVTETMLVSGLNDSEGAINELSAYLLQLLPEKAYLAIPIRPPLESWVIPPNPPAMQNILEFISKKVPFIDLLFEAEISDFISTGIIADDIQEITAVHPMRESALRKMVERAGAGWQVVESLVTSEKIIRLHYRDENFYLHNFKKPSKSR